MLSVDIEKIVPVTSARDMFNKIVDDVEGSDNLYVLTKNGKPAAVVVGVNHLEKLTGETSGEIMTKVDQAAEEPKDDAEEPVKPFDTTQTTPSADEPAVFPTTTPSTDAFSATPATPSSSMPSSDFNAAPAMPDATPSVPSTPDPMAPVTDGDAKVDEPVPATPASTPTSDPFATPKTPDTNVAGSHNPAPGASANTNATPPASN